MRAELICSATMPVDPPECIPRHLYPRDAEGRARAGEAIVKLCNVLLEKHEVDGSDVVAVWDECFIAFFTPRGN